MAKTPLSQDELHQIFKLDPEVIDIEISGSGIVFPVVKTYDDGEHHLKFWCVHCRRWHVHGRGGPDFPYQTGRGGMAGHRSSHCTIENSPFKRNGIILDVVGKFNETIRKQHRKGSELYCPICRNRYSAALNACDCDGEFVNKSRKSSHPDMADKYQEMILHR